MIRRCIFLPEKIKGKYYLAIDIGASSGRHILGHLENGKLCTEEIYRFQNGAINKDGQLVWDIDRIFEHVLTGMEKCKEAGLIPFAISIDTWGVDYVLLDNDGNRLCDAVSYRDHRNDHADKTVEKMIPMKELYLRTGIQKQQFNTICQLVAFQNAEPEILRKSNKLLLIPDYLNYLLTGVMRTEYTNASTTGLLDAISGTWDMDLIKKLNLPTHIFTPVFEPGTPIGSVKENIAKRIGYSPSVYMTTSHDTASAILAIPAENETDYAYISSGTWSLMGTELTRPNLSYISLKYNFTNEGGYKRRYRYLKNIMGLWIVQRLKAEQAPDISYEEFSKRASEKETDGRIDVNDNRFLSPENMLQEINTYLYESGQNTTEDVYEAASVVYRSLAECYARAISEMEDLLEKKFDVINIVGGGSNSDFLNALTAKCTGKKVLAGPSECTAIGNMLTVMITSGEIKDLWEARKTVRRSFDIKEYV
ncbi:MAG: rhamnulokinase [Lachnospiraceae bacterium]|nr:rhamnulokinase [Lachnospiraceae bacterium]